MDEEEESLSLRHHLVNWLFTPLYLLLLFSAVTGYISAIKLSNQPYDLVLVERARLLAGRFDPDAPGVVTRLEAVAREVEGEFHFSLFGADGRFVAGNAHLPRPRPTDLEKGNIALRDTQFNGRKLRLLTFRFRAGQPEPGDYVLQVAEPVTERLNLGRSILGHIVIPQFIFIVIAGIAVWIGLKRGFEPLEKLRRELARRPGDDLRPLDDAKAPGEVRPLIREVNAQIARLKDMMDAQKRFVANAAHQLRTPFAGLRAQAELARREDAPPAVREALERICQGAGRCSRLVNQLLTLARNEPGARDADPFDLLDLNRIAQEAALHWVHEALRRDIDLGFEGSDNRLPLRGDETALRDLIDNLLDNAIRYGHAGGHVTVRTGYDQGAWLRVEDDGPGIAPDNRERIFDRFYRVAGSGQPGSGLGLAIVREVAERHQATVAIEDGAAGRGVSFVVKFPHHGAGP